MKIHVEENSWIKNLDKDLWFFFGHNLRINRLQKTTCCRVNTDGYFLSFFKFCIQNFHVFSEINLLPLYFFIENTFYKKVFWPYKLEKKIIHHLLIYISFYFEIHKNFGNLLAWAPKQVKFNSCCCLKSFCLIAFVWEAPGNEIKNANKDIFYVRYL